jgi:hypothetical protein
MNKELEYIKDMVVTMVDSFYKTDFLIINLSI